jgi:Kef-type K+ transport system membrane component KefB
MFLVGLELETGEVQRHRYVAIVVSHANITAPMTMGAALAIFLYPRLAPNSERA